MQTVVCLPTLGLAILLSLLPVACDLAHAGYIARCACDLQFESQLLVALEASWGEHEWEAVGRVLLASVWYYACCAGGVVQTPSWLSWLSPVNFHFEVQHCGLQTVHAVGEVV